MVKFENCVVVKMKGVESHSKVTSLIGNIHNVKVVVLDNTNGLLQITDKSAPEKVVQKLVNSRLFLSATPVKYFNVG